MCSLCIFGLNVVNPSNAEAQTQQLNKCGGKLITGPSSGADLTYNHIIVTSLFIASSEGISLVWFAADSNTNSHYLLQRRLFI